MNVHVLKEGQCFFQVNSLLFTMRIEDFRGWLFTSEDNKEGCMFGYTARYIKKVESIYKKSTDRMFIVL